MNGVKRVKTASKSLKATGIIIQIIMSNITFPVLRALMIPNCEVAPDMPAASMMIDSELVFYFYLIDVFRYFQ